MCNWFADCLRERITSYMMMIISLKFRLHVTDRGSKANFGTSVSGKRFVELGDPIRLQCSSTGDRYIPEDIDWFKNGDRINRGRYPHIWISKFRNLEAGSLVSELTIHHATTADSGMYICRSSEEAIDSIRVTVLVGKDAISASWFGRSSGFLFTVGRDGDGGDGCIQ